MAMLIHEKTVGEYVKEKPALSKVFEQYGIDYCCGGKISLADACLEKGLVLEDVVQALAAVTIQAVNGEDFNWADASLGQMIDHIYDRHHRYLYEVMPRLSMMANKVARVHGNKDCRLVELARVHDSLQNELNQHMAKEEQVLFPYCRKLETAKTLPHFHCGTVKNPIKVMESEHVEAGELLARMRALTDGYVPPDWACNTYRALLDGLAEMESDIHRHIHEENNILFPKTIEIADALEKAVRD